jgi:hypothetical protein
MKINGTNIQDPLVSGTNIKTINANSILGSGNLSISGGNSNPTAISVVVTNGQSIIGPGSTSPRITSQILIPANTLSTNCILEIVWTSVRLSGASGVIQSQINLSSTAGILGQAPTIGSTRIAIGVNLTSAIGQGKNARDLNKQNTTGFILNANATLTSDFSLGTITQFTINNSSDIYLQFCTSSTNNADTSTIRGIRLTVYQ